MFVLWNVARRGRKELITGLYKKPQIKGPNQVVPLRVYFRSNRVSTVRTATSLFIRLPRRPVIASNFETHVTGSPLGASCFGGIGRRRLLLFAQILWGKFS